MKPKTVNVVSTSSSTGTGAQSAGNTPVTPVSTPASPPKGFELSLQQMLQGFEKFVPVGFTFPSVSGGYSQATVVSQLEQMLALYSAVDQAKESYEQALAQRLAGTPAAHSLLMAVKATVIAYYGKGNPALANFGITTKAAAVKTPIEKAVSVAKARQTRAANGILGKKQKAQMALAKEVQSVASNLAPQGAQVAAPSAAKPTTSG